MISLGGFPGLLEGGDTAIKGEVYEVNPEGMVRLDMLEGCDPRDPDRGMYGRLAIVLEDGREVMTYRYNTEGHDREPISSGDWRAYSSSRKEKRRYQ